MTASSHDNDYPLHKGRLLSQKWQPLVHERGQFLMVNLVWLRVVTKSFVQVGQEIDGSGASTVIHDTLFIII